MSGRIGEFLRVGAALVVVLLVAYAGWRWGSGALTDLTGRGAASGEARVEPTPELAESTLEAVDAFRRSPDSAEMSLSALELASLLRFAAPGVLPDGVTPPVVDFRSDRIRLRTRVAVDAFPPVPEVERLVGVLPDTVSAEVDGSILPYVDGRAALRVQRVRVSGVPLPRSLTPRLLRLLGRDGRPDLPPDAIDVPLPAGLSSAYILSDRLVLVARQAEDGPEGLRRRTTSEGGMEQE